MTETVSKLSNSLFIASLYISATSLAAFYSESKKVNPGPPPVYISTLMFLQVKKLVDIKKTRK